MSAAVSNRRSFLAAAAAMGAALAWGRAEASPSKVNWTERRDLYPEGVASGDPTPDGIILWTRRPAKAGEARPRMRPSGALWLPPRPNPRRRATGPAG